MQKRSLAKSVVILSVLAAALAPVGASAQEGSSPVKIGVVGSIFRDTSPALFGLISQPLKALMQSQTGIAGEMVLSGDAATLAKQLKENQLQLGVFHGHEFAWARQHCPELKPLVLCVANHVRLHAHLVVHKDCPAASCGDLKGKVIALPAIARGHLHLYLERRCPAAGSDPKKFFAQVRRSSDPEEALDDVVDGMVQAAIVERAALDEYREVKPARVGQLKVLHQSETFPASVIAYLPGSLDEATLARFREGLINADKSTRGQELMKMCRISRFAAVPADYEQLLGEILKAYPPPARAKEGK